jgi:hypothetical protein
MKMWSSFEALVVGIVEVKTDCNSAARFKSYIFSENGTWYQIAYASVVPGTYVWHAPAG